MPTRVELIEAEYKRRCAEIDKEYKQEAVTAVCSTRDVRDWSGDVVQEAGLRIQLLILRAAQNAEEKKRKAYAEAWQKYLEG